MKRYYIHLTVRIHRRNEEAFEKNILWSNGSVGYTEYDLNNRVLPKIKADKRVRNFRIQEVTR